MKHFISLGAGVQSSTMALMAGCEKITPMPDAAIFADTQDEPASVYKWLDWLEKQLPFPVHRVTKGSLSKTVTTLRDRKDGTGHWVKSNIPAFTANFDGTKGKIPRQCTWDFKIEPLDKAARRLGGIKHGQKTVGVTQWLGISVDEVSRVKPSRNPWSVFRYPLIEMGLSREDCLMWMKAKGFPKPPRSACVFCPYHSDAEWLRIKTEEPGEFDKAVRIEKTFQRLKALTPAMRGVPYLHSSRKPLDTVDFTPSVQGDMLWNEECEGMCGV